MRVYYPQALLRVTATVQTSRVTGATEQVVFVVRPRLLEIVRNSYREADTLHAEFAAVRFPILPRNIRQALVQAYGADAGGIGTDYDITADPSAVRFIGYVDDPELSLNENDGTIMWKARDYTGLYLDIKRPPASAYPSYEGDLGEALRRILDIAPGGENIALRLERDGKVSDDWPDLDVAAPPGLAEAKIPATPNDTAWDLIKRCCDPLALIPRFELDTLVVSTSRGLFTPAKRPVFVWGINLSDYKESRKLERIKEGIALSAYSVADRGMIVGLYPPAGDTTVLKKLPKTVTKKTGSKAKSIPVVGVAGTKINPNERRIWFSYGTVANQKALNDAAERVFHERSRQEFKGQFGTHRMRVAHVDEFENLQDQEMDVQGLSNGQRVIVDVLPEERTVLAGLSSTDARTAYLVEHGYDHDVAAVLVRSFEDGASGPLEVYCHKATHRYDQDSYSLRVEFQNLIAGTTT